MRGVVGYVVRKFERHHVSRIIYASSTLEELDRTKSIEFSTGSSYSGVGSSFVKLVEGGSRNHRYGD